MNSRPAHLLFSLFLSVGALQAQDSIGLHQAFLDLANDGVVMNISAHPDDEDGSTLAYYRMKFGVTTYSVLFTRGEGGQNEKGPQLYEELGVLRSAETEAAGTILGTEVRFLNFLDFGYSKTATEAFRVWGGQMEALRRLVYVIRKYKPDVLFTNHNTIDGHGHHQAAAITAIAAFDAAADSTIFPEQFREAGLMPWQPKKLFFRVFGRSEQTADVANSIEETDPLRGVGYLDIATAALRQHKTQGMERANLRAFTRGKSLYKLMRASSLFNGDTTSFLGGIDLLRDHAAEFLRPYRAQLLEFHEGMPLDSLLSKASSILTRLDSLSRIPGISPLAQRLIGQWNSKLMRIVTLEAGITITAQTADPIVVSRQRTRLEVTVSARQASLSTVQISFEFPAGWAVNEEGESAPVLSNREASRNFMLQVGDNAIATLPRVTAQYRSLELRQSVCATIACLLNGYHFILRRPVAFDVAPRQELVLQPPLLWLPPDRVQKGLRASYAVMNHLPHKTAGKVRLVSPTGWRADVGAFAIEKEESLARGEIFVKPPDAVREGDYTLQFRTDEAFAEVHVHVFGVQAAPRLNVGVIKSYDTTLEEVLSDLGVQHGVLSDDDLATADLSRWHTIVIDIRAYLVRDALRKNNIRLLDYVRKGGHLVVMYQRDQEWNPEFAPYPFRLSRRRITLEDAPVEVLQPTHPLFTLPNRITDGDWEGWKQERAIYLPVEVSSAYVRLLRSHDPDEPEIDTGYLFAVSGTGTYIYTSYVWYRELKECHAGAFRCFANMISYPLVGK
jgi:LmbE family N-acetylglucosaminyl deacetylase